MKKFYNYSFFMIVYIGQVAFSVASPFAYTNTLDELLKQVMDERTLQTEELLKRENVFRQKKNERKQLLNSAIKELKQLEQIGTKLTATFEKNEKELTILEAELNATVGVLGEFFGVVKQVAGDFRGHVLHSIVSAQIPGREKWIESISARKKLPTTKELRQLWFEIQREMTELGKVTQFPAEVISVDGKKSTRQVTRVGGFNLVSQGQYLGYEEPATGESQSQIATLERQPGRNFTKYISDLESAQSSYHFFALDPSRGSLISILIHVPDLWEKVQQGGWVGLVIICVFLFGFALIIERLVVLSREKRQILSQLDNTDQPTDNNPVGVILMTYEKNKNMDLESLELKLSEVIIKYLPRLERGIGAIKMLAVLSPLLGLLGTVTGMILTFQAITLFGTGDPKLMAGGISQALMTTVMGLCCAIPLLLCHTLIVARAKRLTQILEEQTTGLLARKMQNETTKT